MWMNIIQAVIPMITIIMVAIYFYKETVNIRTKQKKFQEEHTKEIAYWDERYRKLDIKMKYITEQQDITISVKTRDEALNKAIEEIENEEQKEKL